MRRLTLFVKGNLDVHDSLHSCRIGGELRWNGINETLRDRFPGTTVRVQHEIGTRSDALLQATGTPPAALLQRPLALGAYTIESQFSTAVFETRADAIVLSIQPDMATGLVRHDAAGFLLYPCGCAAWPDADKHWLAARFSRIEPPDAAQSIANFAAIIDRIRRRSDAPILIFNVSSVVPNEMIHCWQGLDETYALRSRRFNLALMDLSAQTGISVIDVDSIVARAGADALKLDAAHLTPAGYRLVAEEVVRVLADLGLLEPQTERACAPA